MNTELWDSYVRITRDLLIVFVGTFMLVFETVFAPNPNAYIIGAGLAALGLPPALRLDLRSANKRTSDNGGNSRPR